MTVRCFMPAWIAAWVTAVFLPSVLIVLLGIGGEAASKGAGIARLAARSWQVADDVGPAAKLMMGGLLLVGLLALGRARVGRKHVRHAAAVGVGVVAVAVTIALLPASLSRGFGIGLTGVRFDPVTSALYLLGGGSGGLLFAVSLDRCQRRMRVS